MYSVPYDRKLLPPRTITPLTPNEIVDESKQIQATLDVGHPVYGYKVLKADYETVLGFQYIPGQLYSCSDPIVLNRSGFNVYRTPLEAWHYAIVEHTMVSPREVPFLNESKSLVLVRALLNPSLSGAPKPEIQVGPKSMVSNALVMENIDSSKWATLLTGVIQDESNGHVYHYENAIWHRNSAVGPAIYNPTTKLMRYCEKGKMHRAGDLPAHISADGTIASYYIRGVLHRDSGQPAVINTSRRIQEMWTHGQLIKSTSF